MPKEIKNRTAKSKLKTYAIFPDYWKSKWGEKPLLGFVTAYSKFEAVRQAYTRNLLRQNFTFEPEPKELTRNDVKRYKDLLRKQRRFGLSKR